MGRRLDWLPPRPSDDNTELDVPFVQETPDVVRVLILQLARGAWSTLARLLQLACLTLDYKPLLSHEMAHAGATGVVLDILCQAPRYHPSWKALSTAGAGLLGALVRCEDDGTEAAQPQALRMLLVMLESDLTCGPARQAVATVLHCIVAQRTVHRDKLRAAGALPVLLRMLRRLDVLCDLVAVQELLWTLVYLTDEAALSLPSNGCSPGAERLQPLIAERLVPLLFLFGMPWHAQHEHLSALTTRALHVHVAGYDAGKDTLRASGVLSVLVDHVRRHSAPYIAAAAGASVAASGSRSEYAKQALGDGKTAAGAAPTTTMPSPMNRGQASTTRGSFAVGTVRPASHMDCDVHADSSALHAKGVVENGPYACGAVGALGLWTPWQRLLAVLLISGMVPGVIPKPRRRMGYCSGATMAVVVGAAHGATDSGAEGGKGRAKDFLSESRRDEGAKETAPESEKEEDPSTPSTIRSEDSAVGVRPGSGVSYAGKANSMAVAPGCNFSSEIQPVEANPQTYDGVEAMARISGGSAAAARVSEQAEEEEEDDVFGSNVSELTVASPSGGSLLEVATAGHGDGRDSQHGSSGTDAAATAVADGARMVCYGLMLPLLLDAGEAAAGGAGAAAASVGGALLRRRLCPLRESLATLKTLLCDCEANQVAVSEQGLAALLVQLVAHGDMGLAWQAAEAAVFLSGRATGAALVAARAVEEMAYFIEESAEMLHSLTLRKQIQVQNSTLGHGDHHHQENHRHNNNHHTRAVGAGGQHAAQHPQRNGQNSKTPFGAGSSAGGAAAAPPALNDVHVRPNRTSTAQSCSARPQRVYLVGRVPLDFTTSSSCFYGSHDAMSYCDYCSPSAALKVLLRLMAATQTSNSLMPTTPPEAEAEAEAEAAAAAVAQEDAVCRRFAAAGGMYGVLLLLHHEAAGVHHSKLAASLLTLLDLLLVRAPGAQDELRMAGGLGVLTTLLGSLMRPGVMDVFQLRVATCHTLRLALQGNAANKLAAREHGLLPLLVSLLAGLTQQRKARSSEVVVDDSGPLTSAVLEALAAATQDSPGTQEALVGLGILYPLSDLLRDEKLDTEVRTVAARTLTAVVNKYQAGQAGALVLGVVPPAVAWLEHCCMAASGAVGTSRGGGGGAGTAPSVVLQMVAAAAALTALLGALLHGDNSYAKSAVVSAGALGVLLQLLRDPALAAAAPAAAAGGGSAGRSADGGVTGQAAAVLAKLVDGDTDLQNELVAQGGLTAAADIVRDGGAAAPQALTLLSAMLRSNTFVKNTARHAGVPATLVAVVRRCGLMQSANAAAAASALAELAVGNHANQEAVAVQGGLEVAVDLLRDTFAALPLKILTGGGAIPAATAATAAESNGGKGRAEEQTSGTLGGSVRHGAGPPDGAGRTYTSMPYTAAEAAEDVTVAASLSRLLCALLGLVCACVELNGGNKAYIRELGGVTLLGELLLVMAEALTAQARLSWPPYNSPVTQDTRQGKHGPAQGDGQLQGRAALPPPLLPDPVEAARLRDAAAASRTAVSPAVAAACSALVAVTRESSANLARLEEHPGLSVALFKLLVATDAPTSLAAALAIEWLVIRGRTILDAPSREAFELHLVDVLSLALYVPYAPVPLTFPSSPKSDAAAAGSGSGVVSGFPGAWQQQQQQQQPWYAVVRALMPPNGLVAVAVRDAATVLAAVADTADTLDVQRRQQPSVQQQQQAIKGAAGGKSSLTTTSRGSLPPLETAPIDPVALDHKTGLMVSNLLAGTSSSAGASGSGSATGPGSQAWWAELAGSAAAAFQRVANGALQGVSVTPDGGGGAAAAAAGTGPTVRAAAAVPAAAAGVHGTATTASMAAVRERRRQVAWMLFLLAVKSTENRARLRWLVRASLTPLAQQLANAEQCRAQLEAAAAGPYQPMDVSGSSRSWSEAVFGSGSAAAAGPPLERTSSAALESASSLRGRLPISTGAIEELGDGVVQRSSSPLGGSHAATRGIAHPPPSTASAASAQITPPPPLREQDTAGQVCLSPQQHPQQQQQQQQHGHRVQPSSAHQILHQQVQYAQQQQNSYVQQRYDQNLQSQSHEVQQQQQPQQQQQQQSPQPQQQRPNVLQQNATLPPQSRPPSRPTSSSSACGAQQVVPTTPPATTGMAHHRTSSTGVAVAAAGILHGRSYGTTAAAAALPATASSSSSMPATPREAYLKVAADSPAAAVLRFNRLSRTASGGPVLFPPGVTGSAAGGAAAGSASNTPRTSLTGAVAAAFSSPAAYLGGAAAGRGPRGAAGPSPIRTGRMGHAPIDAAALSAAASPAGSGGAFAVTGGMATPVAVPGQRVLGHQVSAGGSSVMSDDDELTMIQQEVALLANTTSSLAWNAGAPGSAAGIPPGLGGYRSTGTGCNSPAASPMRWGPGGAARR